MKVPVTFHSYFKDLAGTTNCVIELNNDRTIAELMRHIYDRFPKLQPLRKSTLIAVGVEYQRDDYKIQEGDEVSLFPPVQGG